MTDKEFAEAFEDGRILKEEFRHGDHLRLAWYYGTIAGFEECARKVGAAIKGFAERYHLGGLYHETITMFWVAEIYRSIPRCPAASFAEFVKKNAWMKDKNYILSFYSEQLLHSDKARREWVEPDLKEAKWKRSCREPAARDAGKDACA